MADSRPLHVVTMLRARSGCESELRQVARALLSPTRREDGCLRYELVEDPRDPRSLTFIETWESEAHLQAHLASPHLLQARARYAELLDGDLDLRLGHELGST